MGTVRAGIAALTLAGTMAIAGPLPSAEAAPCISLKQSRVDVWGHTTTWQTPYTDARGIRLSAQSYYHFCPNRRRNSKVMPYKIAYCYTHTNGRPGGLAFDGVVFDSAHYDDNKTFSPWAITVPDNGEDQNCRTRYISSDTRKWLVLVHSAGWTAQYKIKKVGYIDIWKSFLDADNHQRPWKFYKPWFDWAVSGWHL